ncbi:MAG: DUF308 domain-containing protein [Gammaproteobacteria bacterium]|nr:DUF308 domain-containing protein [Gammaproteobacteria bacterium]
MNRNTKMGSKSLMFMGIVMCLLGILLLASPIAAGEFVIMAVAAVLTITGIVQVIQSLRYSVGLQRIVSILLGLIVTALGVLVWFNPEIGSGLLMVLLMIFFAVNGLWKISTAMRFRSASGWVWLLLSGILSIAFVALLWSQWPVAGAWVIGVLIGIDLLLSGIAMIALSFSARRIRSSGYVDTINL